VYTRAHLSRIAGSVVALVSRAGAAGAGAWRFHGPDTADHDHYTGFDGFAVSAVSPDVPPMSPKARASLPADEPHPASTASIERVRKVEN
jgi:hypothetical protein